eukprot:CAMPEP_0204523300 /NCGR_PEP_ID=MMETSP0661-20131031/6771_1 /ASSEMBLY_ACC=CAM_ASM_000606 /TAXON_ID=109239 /ORGANISM="Alexandrium margalefi, Strain AMGDE01CS-322" /LENGTH=156 /DNA_ID=CAMNT_0051528999 /DNA_START=60 /DNA_END=527 /DNA_ORIENTATION=+
MLISSQAQGSLNRTREPGEVLAREGAAAERAQTTVGDDDDLPARRASVPLRPAEEELARGEDVKEREVAKERDRGLPELTHDHGQRLLYDANDDLNLPERLMNESVELPNSVMEDIPIRSTLTDSAFFKASSMICLSISSMLGAVRPHGEVAVKVQ